ncbi:unnamed protein product [Brassicogethes aeneus]|uniref:F-box domain-containing protein n=1 Tax=Brassicogethes aeneus TaxID=1431903 RepID=A0A9P0BAZ6_BRAAE|nr:unnamed protein product [Brassicogethes aeneus]
MLSLCTHDISINQNVSIKIKKLSGKLHKFIKSRVSFNSDIKNMNKLLKSTRLLNVGRTRVSSYNVNETKKENGKRKPYKSAEIYPVLMVYKTDDFIEEDVFQPTINISNIDLIDDDILEYILSFLTVVDLVRASGVSKRFNRIIWGADMWKKSLIFDQPVDVDDAIETITSKLWLNAYPKWVKITYLSVTNAQMTDKALNILARHLPSLLYLKIHNCDGVTTDGLCQFTSTCEKLSRIDISGCVNVQGVSFNAARPIYANFTGCSRLRDYGFFDTTNCYDLVILYLNGCSEITDWGIGCLSNHAKKLRKLVLADCIRLTNSSLEHLRNLKDCLEYLSISNTLAITDAGAYYFRLDWPKLQHLDISGCLSIVHGGFYDIGVGCKKLRSLNIANTNVCDKALKDLGLNLVNLKNINLKNCYFITFKGFYSFLMERKTSLKKINIKGCNIRSKVGHVFSQNYFIEYDETPF